MLRDTIIFAGILQNDAKKKKKGRLINAFKMQILNHKNFRILSVHILAVYRIIFRALESKTTYVTLSPHFQVS